MLVRLSWVVPILVLLFSLSATSAGAADLWLQPEPIAPAAGQEIRLRLFQGEPFAGTEQSYHGDRVDSFQRVWRSGRTTLKGNEGGKPAARFRARRNGVQLIGYASDASGSYCKSLVVVGDAPRDDPLRYSELGHRLEIVPQTDPVELLRDGGPLELQVLFEREPLAAARVTAVPESSPAETVRRATTDEIGLATLKLDRPGLWLIRVSHRPSAARGAGGAGKRLTATLTLAAAGFDPPQADR